MDNIQNIKNATLLRSKYRRRDWRTWVDQNKIKVAPQRHLEFESSILTYSAALNGLGVAMAQLPLLENELAEGTLIRPFTSTEIEEDAFYVTWPTFSSTAIKTKKFIDWILSIAGQAPEFYKS